MNFSLLNFPRNPVRKNGNKPIFQDDFNTETLQKEKWFPYYLPQWSSRRKSKPTYVIANGKLKLQITKSQKPWCPEFDGAVKCSSIQTGVFSGKKGSPFGQHRFNKKCRVREEQTRQSTFLKQYGYFEIRAKFAGSTSNVISLWMIGFEDLPHKSAEICVFEIKGWNIRGSHAKIGYGLHAFGDPAIQEAFYEDEHQIDVKKFHIYAVKWTSKKVSFYIDNKKVREIPQSPGYEMQLMLGIYRIPGKENIADKHDTYPNEFMIDYVRVYQ